MSDGAHFVARDHGGATHIEVSKTGTSSHESGEFLAVDSTRERTEMKNFKKRKLSNLEEVSIDEKTRL